MTGFHICPLRLGDLEVAGKLNRHEYHGDNNDRGGAGDSKKRKRTDSQQDGIGGGIDEDMNSEEYTCASASPFLLWSTSTQDKDHQNDKLHFRTGRWSSSETFFVETLIQCFDNATLPLPHGIKLNEFLKDLLMCKRYVDFLLLVSLISCFILLCCIYLISSIKIQSSRLTKKMKNAKLSHRNYKLIMATPAIHDIKAVSQAQQNFLDSIPSQVTRLILKFNMSRIWRLHFSNLCLQTGYESVLGGDWLQSLEDFDNQVKNAETAVKRYRRERLIKALRSDSFQDCIDGVYVGPNNEGIMAANNAKIPRISSGVALSTLNNHLAVPNESTVTAAALQSTYITEESPFSEQKPEPAEEFSTISLSDQIPRDLTITTIKLKDPTVASHNGDNFSIDFLDDLDGSLSGETYLSLKDTRLSYKKKNMFLSRIMSFLESQNLPIHCIDCWVPSNTKTEEQQSSGQHVNQFPPLMRLVHAGDDLRSDLTSITEFQLHEFGVYSKKFSFDPGAGLPGRCYSSLTYSWENNIQTASPEHFKRLGGARYAGIMTAIGLPIQYPKIGTIVIGLYSLTNLNYNSQMLEMCKNEFQKFEIEPKWNLSLDVSTTSDNTTSFSEIPSTGDLSNQSKSTLCHQNHANDQTSNASSHNKSSNGSVESSSGDSQQLNTDQAMEMANFIGEHIPSIEQLNDRSDMMRSLRMQLLNFPDNVAAPAKRNLKTLWRSYKSYCKVQREKRDIVKLLMSDWEFMMKEEKQDLSPWGSKGMTHVDYSVSNNPPPNLNSSRIKSNTASTTHQEVTNNRITSTLLSANSLSYPPTLGGSISHDPNEKLTKLVSSDTISSIKTKEELLDAKQQVVSSSSSPASSPSSSKVIFEVGEKKSPSP